MMTRAIACVESYWIRLPLQRPYHLSLVTLEAFDSVVVRIRADDGREGVGEATDCPGYYTERLEDAWEFVCRRGLHLPGRDPQIALDEILSRTAKVSFAAAPLLTALECLAGTAPELPKDRGDIPLMGIVQGETAEEVEGSVQGLLQAGYHTLKVKVGFAVDDDLEKVRRVQSLISGGTQIRLDANQGYDEAQARRFLQNVDPTAIELLEQPLPPGHWDEMVALAAVAPVPLMLDEGIVVEADLDRAIASGCVQAVKFKLMKCGSFGLLERMIDKAQAAGLKVILGNGVATDIGCLHEAQVACRMGLVNHAGEMNGFLKCSEQLLEPELRTEGEHLHMPPKAPAIRWDAVNRLSTRTAGWGESEIPGRC
jgi:o-succinylbenzoate synthase